MYSWIRKEREKRRLSQSKLSKLTGISQSHLSTWEHKKATPNAEQEKHILQAFVRYDKLVASGRHTEFLKKTRWSKEYKSSRYAPSLRNTISMQEVEAFAHSNRHDHRSPERFSANSSEKLLKVTGISLFAGCGGLTMGFHEAGVRIVGHVEINEAARRVFQRNFPNSTDLGHDIRKIDREILKKLQTTLPEIHVILGGPPCQGFSLTGKRDVYDPRNQLYKDYARFVEILRPKVFILENVRLLTSMKTPSGALLINDLLKTFRDLDYKVDYAELNALNYGVPQSRERLFVIGLDKTVFERAVVTFPQPTHVSTVNTELSLFDHSVRKPLTLRDAIGDLDYLESGEKSPSDPLHFAVSHPSHVIEMLKNVPEGRSAHDNHDPVLRPRSGYNTTYKRLKWDEPSSTISTTFGMISGSRNVHPTATRSLTIREALRCQTFPDDFIIFGSLGDVRTMIGNAVPPKLAYAIARHIIERYLCNQNTTSNICDEMIEVSSL